MQPFLQVATNLSFNLSFNQPFFLLIFLPTNLFLTYLFLTSLFLTNLSSNPPLVQPISCPTHLLSNHPVFKRTVHPPFLPFNLPSHVLNQVPVQYSFINRLKPDSHDLSKPWLRIRNASDIIMPGYQQFVQVEICVDHDSAASLTRGDDVLDEILILHLENGRDIFLTVSGEYRPSCFGCDLWTLCHAMRPIKDMTIADIKSLRTSVDAGIEALSLVDQSEDGDGRSPPQHAYDIPKELWVMVDYIFKYGLDRRDLFSEMSSDPTDLIRVRDFLDSYSPDTDLPSPEFGLSVDAVANALLIFLQSLPEPIIPFRLYDKCLASANSANDVMDIVQQLPSFHRSSFQYLVAFINEYLHHQERNGTDREIVVTFFGRSMIRSPVVEHVSDASMGLIDIKKYRFLNHFLDGDEFDDLNTY